MKVTIAFVGFEIGGEFTVTGDIADFGPYTVDSPPSDVVRLRLTGYQTQSDNVPEF